MDEECVCVYLTIKFALMQQSFLYLSLFSNQIESLDNSGINLLQKLQFFYLDNNLLKAIPANTFNFMNSALLLLSLHSNQLETLNNNTC